VSAPVLNTIVPEFQVSSTSQINTFGSHNCHFHVNTKAEILFVDSRLEEQKTLEEEQHGSTGTLGLAGITGSNSTSKDSISKTSASDLPPGFRPTKLVHSPKSKTSSSMFMPSKKPTSLFNTTTKNRPTSTATNKALLMRRKGGTAQALLAKGPTMNQRMMAASGGAGATAASTGSAATAGTTGLVASAGTTKTPLVSTTAGRFTAGKGRAAMAKASRMKMLDSEEAKDLEKSRANAATASDPNEDRAMKRKRIMEAAQRNKKLKTTPHQEDNDNNINNINNNNNSTNTNGAAPAAVPPTVLPSSTLPEWQKLLQERSNKMTDEDKVRVRQFFVDKYNPTPTEPVRKMKIHEQRLTDPTTGQDIKETYYLELDYTTMTSKQSKKVKRY
jgi:hypothetical protein